MHSHCGKGGCSYTADMIVNLARRAALTDVHVPDAADEYGVGQTVSVLLDPRDPGYAEIQGKEYVHAAQWIIPSVLTVLALTYTGFNLRPTERGVWGGRAARRAEPKGTLRSERRPRR